MQAKVIEEGWYEEQEGKNKGLRYGFWSSFCHERRKRGRMFTVGVTVKGSQKNVVTVVSANTNMTEVVFCFHTSGNLECFDLAAT